MPNHPHWWPQQPDGTPLNACPCELGWWSPNDVFLYLDKWIEDYPPLAADIIQIDNLFVDRSDDVPDSNGPVS